MTSTAAQSSTSQRFLLWLLLYVGIHFLVRLAMGGTYELDESEQVVLGQQLELGYTTQPPLYTWLQWGFFRLFGSGVLALALLKSGLIFSIYFFVWQIARRVINRSGVALLAAFSLILIPSVSWESIRDLTHSVLATAIAAAAFYSALRIYEDRSTTAYLLLGVLLAAGMLAKYSFVVLILSLLLAALSLPTWRRPLFDKRILLTISAAVVLVVPHLLWALDHFEAIQAFISEEVNGGERLPFVEGVIVGAGSLVKGIAEFSILVLLVISLIYPRLYRRLPRYENSYYDLLERFLLAAIIVCLGLVLFMGTTQFQSRWFQPILILLPIYLLARASLHQASPRRDKILAGVLLFFASIIIILRFGQFWLAPYISDKPNRMQLPSAAIAKQIEEKGFEAGTIISPDNLTGANLKLYFPGSRVLSARTEFFTAAPRSEAGQCLIAWNARKHKEMPNKLRNYLQQLGLSHLQSLPALYIEAPYEYSPYANFTLGFILLEDGASCNGL